VIIASIRTVGLPLLANDRIIDNDFQISKLGTTGSNNSVSLLNKALSIIMSTLLNFLSIDHELTIL
jgi:hypothetical protein